MELIFASHNENKVREIAELIGNKYMVKSLSTIGFNTEIEENGSTLTENALIKARTIYQATNKNCFADDTGLLVEALNNEPGVYSARYAGLQKDTNDNMDLLLKKLVPFDNKNANFNTVIALILNGQEYLFEGSLFGKIIPNKIGTNGFGYDPIFIPNKYDITLAQMDLQEKNKISHRALAFSKMVDFLHEFK
ncbi:MAG: RdgB/HAM1 family non-canonical purine NTP pyrophosphatase [Candidatus Methylacidiphilales bacterium]